MRRTNRATYFTPNRFIWLLVEWTTVLYRTASAEVKLSTSDFYQITLEYPYDLSVVSEREGSLGLTDVVLQLRYWMYAERYRRLL